jgi:hypothetical protein
MPPLADVRVPGCRAHARLGPAPVPVKTRHGPTSLAVEPPALRPLAVQASAAERPSAGIGGKLRAGPASLRLPCAQGKDGQEVMLAGRFARRAWDVAFAKRSRGCDVAFPPRRRTIATAWRARVPQKK